MDDYLEEENLEVFTNVIRNRFYNSGYREGLFKGKSEVIQDGFDRGYQVGSLFAVLKVVEGSLLNTENSNETGSDEEVEESKIIEEIEEIRKTLQERIPEIKIASNLFK